MEINGSASSQWGRTAFWVGVLAWWRGDASTQGGYDYAAGRLLRSCGADIAALQREMRDDSDLADDPHRCQGVHQALVDWQSLTKVTAGGP